MRNRQTQALAFIGPVLPAAAKKHCYKLQAGSQLAAPIIRGFSSSELRDILPLILGFNTTPISSHIYTLLVPAFTCGSAPMCHYCMWSDEDLVLEYVSFLALNQCKKNNLRIKSRLCVVCSLSALLLDGETRNIHGNKFSKSSQMFRMFYNRIWLTTNTPAAQSMGVEECGEMCITAVPGSGN